MSRIEGFEVITPHVVYWVGPIRVEGAMNTTRERGWISKCSSTKICRISNGSVKEKDRNSEGISYKIISAGLTDNH
jgi:hypothetical protein